MARSRTFGVLLVSAALVSACNGSGGSSTQYFPGGGSTSSATPSPTPISSACPKPPAGSIIYASPNPVVIEFVGSSVALSICEANYTGTFSVNVTSNMQNCNAVPFGASNVWSIQGLAAGTCTLTIKDQFSNQLQVPVTVS